MLRHAESRGAIQGLRICRGAPSISHLLFVDDTLVFCKAKRRELQAIGDILDDYRKASGQLINLQKSSMFFSKNTGADLKRALSSNLVIPVRTDLGKYLGLPTEVGKSKTEMFNYIKERVLQKLAGWKEKILNQAGKEVLLKSVALALPTYAMMCFKLPKGLCHQIESAMASFWWGQKNNERKIHCMKWSRFGEQSVLGLAEYLGRKEGLRG
ncbi:hypothetical protein RHSIM_Rhsim01G0173900 [Rhododendron simsii]|uniref:Reverse transcriptase domain-containing protein n=1 Tax=Rhododendron simsii TaxID=118357 RepID=A0A834HGK0_RHOSS|nr:hypothetical protein RHSIM_Rhsim01G0173900 [Rhododendron simsii]